MDKNKAAFKLKGFGPIYYLNLDGQPERKEYMEDQFKYWEIENYTRISAMMVGKMISVRLSKEDILI